MEMLKREQDGRDVGSAPMLRTEGPSRASINVPRQQAKEIVIKAPLNLPGVGTVVDKPRTQPLKSSHIWLERWMKAEYGTLNKPAELAELPWDHIEEDEDRQR